MVYAWGQRFEVVKIYSFIYFFRVKAKMFWRTE